MNVLPRSIVTVLLRQSEVDEEELITVAPDSHQKIVWLNISMDEVLVVNKLNATNHLICEHEDRLHCESPRAEIEKVFEARSQ